MAIQDVITLSVVIAILVVGVAVGGFVLTNVIGGLLDTGLYDPAIKTTVETTNAKWYTYFDYGVGIWFFLLWFRLPVTPLF